MQAVVYQRYGPPDVLHIEEVEKPVPKENEVLVRVYAASVTLYDCWMRSSTAPPGFWLPSRIDSGIRRPKQPVLGTDLAGEVEAVGSAVTRFKPGDAVFGYTGMYLGTHAEYVCLAEDAAALKPANATFEEAAAVLQGALTALYFLRHGHIQRGQKVLIFGASGGVGSFAVQLARYFGAEVTGVCSTAKMDMVKSLGADHVIDYTREDFTESNEIYDIIFDTVGKTPVLKTKRLLKKTGYYLFATFGLPKVPPMLWMFITRSPKVFIGALGEKPEDLRFLKERMEAGELKAIVDRCYPMAQVAEAHRHIESGRKTGAVVITMAPQLT